MTPVFPPSPPRRDKSKRRTKKDRRTAQVSPSRNVPVNDEGGNVKDEKNEEI